MLGNPGSNPLELFWDIVDKLDQELDEKIAIVEGAIARHNKKLGFNEENNAEDTAEGEQTGGSEVRGFFVSAETSEEEFKSIVRANADDAVNTLGSGDLHVIYRTVRLSRFRNAVDSLPSSPAA